MLCFDVRLAGGVFIFQVAGSSSFRVTMEGLDLGNVFLDLKIDPSFHQTRT